MKTRAGVKNKVVRSWEPAKKFEDGFHVYFTMPVCSVVVSLKGVPGLFLNEATHPLVNGRK
jgi:predicted transcriptional regulator